MRFLDKNNKSDHSNDEPVLLLLVSEEKYFLSHRLSLAKRARAAGYRVVVGTKSMSGDLRSLGLDFDVVDIDFQRSIGRGFSELRALNQLRRCISLSKPTIVHAVSLKVSILAALCLLGSKNVYLLCAFTGFGHAFTSHRAGAKIIKAIVVFLLKGLLRNCRYWSVVQNIDDFELLKKIRGNSFDRTRIIKGSGVDINFFSFSGLPRQVKKKVLFPGRLLGDKGIYEFVGAARLIRSRRSDVDFILAGHLDETNPSTVSSKDLKEWIEDYLVEWVGEVKDIRTLFRESCVVCLPSYREGLPKSLLEAASTGRPIVSTDVPGCREICRHQENGLLVPVKNAEKLAFALEKLLNDFELCGRFGIAGRKIVENEFSDNRINDDFISMYEQVRRV